MTEIFTSLETWQMIGLILIAIPVLIAIGAAVIFALGWVFWLIVVIAFKLALIALAVAAVFLIGIALS